MKCDSHRGGRISGRGINSNDRNILIRKMRSVHRWPISGRGPRIHRIMSEEMRNLFLEMIYHGAVQGRPVTIVGAIHLVEIVGLAKLHQTARLCIVCGAASNQLERSFAKSGVANIGEYPSQILLAH